MRKYAEISECGRYRWSLKRIWNDDLPIVTWIMLNPSTANAFEDDPTIRRCISFSKEYGGIEVLNIFALRATDPKELAIAENPEGEKNSLYLKRAFGLGPAVFAWGANRLAERAVNGLELPSNGLCLGTTKSGAPKHPLYVKGDTKLVPWKGYVR